MLASPEVGRKNINEKLDKRCLPAPLWPSQSEDAAVRHGERDGEERRNPAVIASEARGEDGGLGVGGQLGVDCHLRRSPEDG